MVTQWVYEDSELGGAFSPGALARLLEKDPKP